jgi:hypothetical protein
MSTVLVKIKCAILIVYYGIVTRTSKEKCSRYTEKIHPSALRRARTLVLVG